MVPGNDGEVVLGIGPPDQFVNRGLEEKWIAEAEREFGWVETSAGSGVRWNV